MKRRHRSRSYWFAIGYLVTLGNVLQAAETSNALNHFEWSGVSSPQQNETAISVTIFAKDIGGQLISTFNGQVAIFCGTTSAPPSLFITEVDTGVNDRIELINPTDAPRDVSGFQITLFDNTTWPAPKTNFVFPPGIICPMGGVLELRAGGIAPGSFPIFNLGTSLSWNNSSQGNPVAVLLRDADGGILDFVCAVDAYPSLIAQVTGLSPAAWTGLPVPFNGLASRTYQRIGLADRDSAADWIATNSSIGLANPGLQLPTASRIASVPVSPPIVNLTNGVWAGTLVLTTNGARVFLRADDGDGHAGDSNPFDISQAPALGIQLPSQAFESSAGPFGQGTISLPFVLSSNLQVTLTSLLPDEVSVPAAVVISGGQINAHFNLTNWNDTVLDGSRAVRITASAPGFISTSGSVINFDNETAALTLIAPTHVTEGSGRIAAAGTVTATAPASTMIAVQLSSSDPTRLQVPPSAYILPGQTSAVFDITVPNNGAFQEPLAVTLSAAVSGWTGAETVVTVRDNESTNLTFVIPTQVFENAGLVSNAVVRLGGTLATNLQIQLLSDQPELLQVPPFVTIPAGQTSVVFTAVVVDDSVGNSNRLTRVTAHVDAFGPALVDINILDDEVDHFTLAQLPSSQLAGTNFPITAYAQNLNGNVISVFNGVANLRARGIWGTVPAEPPVIGPFTNGVWSGLIRIPTESPATVVTVEHSNGSIGESNPFDVAAARIYNLSASDLAYDPFRQKIWAGLLSDPGATNGRIAAIDPVTGVVSSPLLLNNQPGKLALSDNGQFLYVGLNTTGGVARIDLNAYAIDLRFGLGIDGSFGVHFVDDMEVVPGRPQTLVVSRRVNFNAYNQGLAAYDNGVQRPDTVGPAEFANNYRVSFYDSPTNFYSSYPTGLRRLVLTPTGVTLVQEFRGQQYGADMEFDGHLSYGTSGEVFEPHAFKLIGRFGSEGWVRPITAAGRVFFALGTQLHAFGATTFLPVGRLTVPNVSGSPLNLIHAGANRLAFSTSGGQLVIVETGLLPLSPETDLLLTQNSAPANPRVGHDLTYTLISSNAGPLTATNVVVNDWIAQDVDLISFVSSQGMCSQTNGIVTCELGALPSGASALVTVTVRPRVPGTVINTARVIGGSLNPMNDLSRKTNVVVFDSNLPAVTSLPFNAQDLAFDSASNRLWASVRSFNGQSIPSLRAIDLNTGLLDAVVPLPTPPSQLAISSNGRYLYAGINEGTVITRLDTASRALGPQFSVAGFTDMEVLPETPTAVAVSIREGNFWRGISIFENGILTGSSHPDLNASGIEFSRSNTPLYGLSWGPVPALFRLGVTNYAITILNITEGLFGGFASELKFGSNLLFGYYGEAVNPQTLTRVANFPAAGSVRPDPDRDLVFYLSQQEGDRWVLTAFHESSLQLAWSYFIPGVRGFAERLVRCGPGILAFRTSEAQLFILNTSVMAGSVAADLAVTTLTGDINVLVGSPAEIILYAKNQGPAPAYGVVLTNTLSGPANILSVTSSQGGCTVTSTGISCNLGDFAVSAGATVTLRFTGTNAGTVSNLAFVSHSESDPFLTNNTTIAPANFIGVPKSDLGIDQVINPETTTVGSNVAFSITVTNRGPDDAPDVLITYTLPPGAVVESATSSQGSVSIGGSISAALGTLGNASSASLTIVLRPSYAGMFVSRVVASSSINDPSPSNNEARPSMAVVSAGATNLLEQFTLPGVLDIAYDTTRQKIFASVGPQGGPLSNSIVGMGITTGALSNIVAVGDQIGFLTISDNGEYIYVERTSTGGVSRINVPENMVDLSFEVYPQDGPRYGNVGDMEVLPGQPQSLAASVRSGQSNVGLMVFDNGIPRPNTGPGGIFGGTYGISFASPTLLYQVPPRALRVLSVNESGIQLNEEVSTLTPLSEQAFEYDSGRIYFHSGRVIDPVAKTIVAQYPVIGQVAPDAVNNRVYFLTQTSAAITLRAFSTSNTQEVWSVSVPAGSGSATRLIKLGTNGLAFVTDAGRVFVFRPWLMEPAMADLSVQQTATPNPVTVGDTVTATITVQNLGPWTVPNVVVTNPLPANIAFVSVTSSQGSCTNSNGLVSCSLGALPNGASATITVRFSPSSSVVLFNGAGVAGGLPDENPSNNTVAASITVAPTPTVFVSDVSVREGNAPTSVSLIARLSAPSSQSITLQYQTTNGTAVAGTDYNSSSGSVTFQPESVSRSILLNGIIRGNSLVQSNRYFSLNFNATNAITLVTQPKVVIVDDDFYAFSANSVSVAEGDSGVTSLMFAVSLQPPPSEPVTVDYQTFGGTATMGDDFYSRAGSLVFAAGVTNKLLSIPVFGDVLYEPNESFTFRLSNPVGAILSANEVTGSILNDDAVPTPTITHFQATMGEFILRFPTVEGKSYRVERSRTLEPGAWTVVSEVVGNGVEAIVRDAMDATQSIFFYRVVIP